MAAPKGNKFAIGNEGKSLKFPTVDSLQEAVDAYFAEGGEAWDMSGEYPMFMPTMSGLALALGVDRRTLVNYSNKEDYFPTIKKARALVEQALERRLYLNNPTGTIFNLKNNFGWNDKTELDHTSNGNTLNNWVVNPVTTSKGCE